jgi:hypothetical protein
MTEQDLAKVLPMLEAIQLIVFNTREKRALRSAIIKLLENGEHDYTRVDYRTHGSSVGRYKIIDEVTRQDRGYVRKFMGKKVVIVVYKCGKGAYRYAIISVVTP